MDHNRERTQTNGTDSTAMEVGRCSYEWLKLDWGGNSWKLAIDVFESTSGSILGW